MLLVETPIRVQEVAREVARCAREILGSDVEVIWFGSWPEGHARAHSDLDIAICAGMAIPPDKFARFRDAVDEIPTLYEVDLVDFEVVGPLLRQEILRSGVRL